MWPNSFLTVAAGFGGKLKGGVGGRIHGAHGAWDIEGEPYTFGAGFAIPLVPLTNRWRPDNIWGRIALLFAPVRFSLPVHRRHGRRHGPCRMRKLPPYYDKWSPISAFLGPGKTSPARRMESFFPLLRHVAPKPSIKKACDKPECSVRAFAAGDPDQALNGARSLPLLRNNVAAAVLTASNFSSSQVMIPPAQATGRFTLIHGRAMAREIVVGKDGKAEAVSYIDKSTRSEKRGPCQSIMVAASAANRHDCC